MVSHNWKPGSVPPLVLLHLAARLTSCHIMMHAPPHDRLVNEMDMLIGSLDTVQRCATMARGTALRLQAFNHAPS